MKPYKTAQPRFGWAVFESFTIWPMVELYFQRMSRWLKSERIMRITRWGVRGGTAILDQGLFSGSNFILNIFLARWLSPEQYGAFALAFAIYLFFSGFQNAFILEPMSVFGTARHVDSLRLYAGAQFFIHAILSGLSALLILTPGLILHRFFEFDEFLFHSVIGVGIFLPLMLLLWLARRTCYVMGLPVWSLISSVVYAVLLMSGMFLLRAQNLISNAVLLYFLLGVASLAGSLVIYLNPHLVAFDRSYWKSLLSEQWEFGKWIVIAAFANFAGTQGQLFILAAFLGLEQTGAFRALQNFMLPMVQILSAVSTLGLPPVAYEFGRKSYKSMRVKSFRVASVLIAFSLIYVALLYIFRAYLEQFLYSGKFSQYAGLIPLIGLVPVVMAIEAGYSLVVRALQRPVYYAIMTGGVALVGVTLGLLLTQWLQLTGAVLSLLAVALTSLGINAWFYYKWYIPSLSKESRGD